MPQKCVCGRGSALDPVGGAYSAPPYPLAGNGGGAPVKEEGQKEECEGRGDEGRGGERRKGKGKEGEGLGFPVVRSLVTALPCYGALEIVVFD